MADPTNPLSVTAGNLMALLSAKQAAPGLIDESKILAWFAKRGWTTVDQMYAEAAMPAWQGVSCDAVDASYAAGNQYNRFASTADCYSKYAESLTNWLFGQYSTNAVLNPQDPIFRPQQGTNFRASGSSMSATFEKVPVAGTSTATVIAVALGAVAVAGAGYYAWTQSQKKAKSNPAGLRSQINNSRVEREVRALAKRYAPEADQVFTNFEHGQWWVSVSPDPDDPNERNSEATFSVVDTVMGLDLERV